jgi:hypothetical protein
MRESIAMKITVKSLVGAIMMFVSASSVYAQQTFNLRRSFQTGERWATEYSTVLRIKTTESMLGSYPTPGYSQDEGK